MLDVGVDRYLLARDRLYWLLCSAQRSLFLKPPPLERLEVSELGMTDIWLLLLSLDKR